MEARPPKHQEEHISRMGSVVVTIAALLFTALLIAVAARLLELFRADMPQGAQVSVRPTPTAEISNVRSELLLENKPGAGQRLRAEQETELHGYAWVDKGRGIVRIPIDVAMDIVVQEQP